MNGVAAQVSAASIHWMEAALRNPMCNAMSNALSPAGIDMPFETIRVVTGMSQRD